MPKRNAKGTTLGSNNLRHICLCCGLRQDFSFPLELLEGKRENASIYLFQDEHPEHLDMIFESIMVELKWNEKSKCRETSWKLIQISNIEIRCK